MFSPFQEKHVFWNGSGPLAHFWRFVIFFNLFEQQFDSKICFVCQSLKSYWTLWNQVERPSDQRKKDLRDLWEPELHLSTPSADVTNSALLDMKNIPSITTILVSFNYPTWRKISSNMLAVCVSLWHVSWKFPSYQNNFMQTNHAEVTWKHLKRRWDSYHILGEVIEWFHYKNEQLAAERLHHPKRALFFSPHLAMIQQW